MANPAAVLDLTQSSEDEEPSGNHVLNVWVPQCPCPKPTVSYGPGRGGHHRHYMATGVKKKMKEFGDIVKASFQSTGFTMIPKDRPVVVKVWCFLSRPDGDFVGRRRQVGNLRPAALTKENTVVVMKPDTDNLAKFVLDALTGIVFADDAQIVDLHMLKLRDSEGDCKGRVAVHASEYIGDWTEMMPSF
jgi:Holliday junction resolvase RusA-like endonuclease